MDVARIAVEKEIQNQPDQQAELPDQQVEQPDQQVEQPGQQVEQPDQEVQQPVNQKPDQEVEQPVNQNPDQQLDQKTDELDQTSNQQADQQSEHSDDGKNEVDNLNDEQSSTKEASASQDYTETGDDATKQTSEQPSDTETTAPIASQIGEQHKDETEAAEHPESSTPNPSNIQGTTTAEDTTIPALLPEVSSELTTQHQDESTTGISQHTPTNNQESEVPGEPTTKTDDEQGDNSTSMIAELSMENVAAHDIANPPVLERNTTQQTLTNVTLIDNPIRLEQLSRSSLDSDDSKKLQSRQITQPPSTSTGNINKEDDIIVIAGTVDTTTMKSSISSSSLSNVSALTDKDVPTSQ